MEEAKWYVAHTFSGYENKVASNILTVVENRNLHDLIHEVAIPTETVKELKSLCLLLMKRLRTIALKR